MRSVPFLLLVASLAFSGCYMYVPSSPREVSPGDPVRFRLTADEAARHRDLRLPNPGLIEGTLVERGDAERVHDAHVGRAGAAEEFREMVKEVSIPLSGILDVELRKLDSTKAGLLVLGGAVALAAVVVTSGGG